MSYPSTRLTIPKDTSLVGGIFVVGSTNLKIAASFMPIATVRLIYSKKVTTIWISQEWLRDFFIGAGHGSA
jgi:hypothetical protein